MLSADLDLRFRLAQGIVREAGALALDHYRRRDRLRVEFKHSSPQAVVSEADSAVEALIRERLHAAFPNDGVLGEEGGLAAGASAESGLWVADPIDGTSPFLAGIPAWCVSLGFVQGGEAVFGAVFDPCNRQLYAARQGAGASLNGEPIRVSERTALTQGSVGVGSSERVPPEPATAFIGALLAGGGMYYRNGSGALMLCYVAAGGLLGYYEPHINAWDCMAGLVLVHEAGGWTNDFLADDGLGTGNPILAAAPGVRDQLYAIAAPLHGWPAAPL